MLLFGAVVVVIAFFTAGSIEGWLKTMHSETNDFAIMLLDAELNQTVIFDTLCVGACSLRNCKEADLKQIFVDEIPDEGWFEIAGELEDLYSCGGYTNATKFFFSDCGRGAPRRGCESVTHNYVKGTS